MTLRSLRRPLRPGRARRAADGGPFDIGVVHTVDGAAPADLAAWYEDRRERRIDRYDEVWNGVYVLSPIARNEHQHFVFRVAQVFSEAAGDAARVLPGANISDQPRDWSKNFRTPDVVVVLPGNARCQDRDTHYYGGPDLVVEVESQGDRARQKFGFYAAVGVREYLILDHPGRAPLLYRLERGEFAPVAALRGWLASAVLPLAFQAGGPGRLLVKATRGSRKRWTIGP